MPDLVNLSLFAALKLSHCSSDDALDVLVKSLTNGFDSEPAFEPRILKRTRGSLDRVKKPPTADKAFQDCLKDPFLVGAPKMGECCFVAIFVTLEMMSSCVLFEEVTRATILNVQKKLLGLPL
ncbi:hypothetical protein JHK82_038387 [Glycine max]|nr:hypothetical protein JHK82_038387 [Glycine max]KAG5132391.1 hypothetical protein JHK84_038788 [Glycine max]